jgi:hypothetical protein
MRSEQTHDVINDKTPVYPAAAWPEITFADSFNLHFNGDLIDAIHIPKDMVHSCLTYHGRKRS